MSSKDLSLNTFWSTLNISGKSRKNLIFQASKLSTLEGTADGNNALPTTQDYQRVQYGGLRSSDYCAE